MSGATQPLPSQSRPSRQQQSFPGRITVKVRPGARKTRIAGRDGDVLLIDLAAPAQDNKANIELLKLLKRESGKHVRIVLGATRKEKVVAFD